MNKLNWSDFDRCILSISKNCKNKNFVGGYGFPRGGICIAVSLSHSLGIPLLDKPINNALIVDDIYETGYTLNKIKGLEGIEAYVWISKTTPTWYKAYKYIKEDEWIIFPWENINASENDKNLYYQSRENK